MVHGLSCPMAREIFLDRGQTCVPCIGRWFLNHWTISEVPYNHLYHPEVNLADRITYLYVSLKTNKLEDFPGGPKVKNLPAKQGTWVQSLVLEDPTWWRTTKPMHLNCWALESGSHNYWNLHALEPKLCNKKSHHNEKPTQHNEE